MITHWVRETFNEVFGKSAEEMEMNKINHDTDAVASAVSTVEPSDDYE